MEPVLTKEEIAAVVAGQPGASREPTAERVDLAGGDRLLRALLPSLDPFSRSLAERLRALLTPQLKVDVRAQIAPAEIASPSSWPRHAGYSALASLRVGDMAFGGLLVLDPPLVSLLVARAFGSRRPLEDPPERPLSAVERRVLVPIVESIVHEIGNAFTSVAPLGFTLIRIEANEHALDLDRWGGTGLLIAATLSAGEAGGVLALGLSSAALEPLRTQVGRAVAAAPMRESTARIARLVRDATLEVTAVLGRSRLTLAQLVALRPGDVVHLDRAVGDPIPLQVEGVAKFRGRPVMSRGSLAIELSARTEDARS